MDNKVEDVKTVTKKDENEETFDDTNRCTECGVDLGELNPRQYCGKTHCDNKISDD